MYDTSVTIDADVAADDSDGSIVTMGGADDEDDESDYADEMSIDEEGNIKKGGINFNIDKEEMLKSAQNLMTKIGHNVNDAVNVMADEAEYAQKVGKKMYEIIMAEKEKRQAREGGTPADDKRDDASDEDDDDDGGSLYSDEEEDSYYSSGSEESYEEQVGRNSRKASTTARGSRR